MLATIAFTILIVLLCQTSAALVVLIRRPVLFRRLARALYSEAEDCVANPERRYVVRHHKRNPRKEKHSPAGIWRDLQGPVAERIENEVISGLVNFGVKESAARKLVIEQQLLLKTDRKRTPDAAVTFDELWRLSIAAYQTAQSPRK